MVTYKCFQCERKIGPEYLRSKIRCVYCGSKMLYKERSMVAKVKAR